MWLLLSVVFIIQNSKLELVSSRPWQLPCVSLPHTYLSTSNLPAPRFKCSGLRTCPKEEWRNGASPPSEVLVVQEGLRREVARAGPGRMRAGALE